MDNNINNFINENVNMDLDEKRPVKEFIEEYINSDDKTSLLNSIIKTKYVPIAVKQVCMQNLVKQSISESELGIKYINLFLCKVNLALCIVKLYTSLQLSTTDVYSDYDLLTEQDLINKICLEIGKSEINELFEVNKTFIDNWNSSNKGFESIFNNSINMITSYINNIISGIEKTETFQNVIKDIKK